MARYGVACFASEGRPTRLPVAEKKLSDPVLV
jgi:hypothetical protein